MQENKEASNGWSSWKNHVLREQTRLSKETEVLHDLLRLHIQEETKVVTVILNRISRLEVKIHVWGGLLSLILASLVGFGFKFLM